MKKNLLKQTFFLLLLTAMACEGPALPEIQGFDAYVWKRDKFGCARERLTMADTLLAQREKLVQLDEKEVIRILGSPDARELYVRNQKFLVWLLEPNQRCHAPEEAPVHAKALHVRLNALGKANEVYISAF